MTQDPLAIAATVVKLASSGLFDRQWYVRTYPAAVADGGEALLHYCNSGWFNGFNPSFYFNSAEYLAAYEDVRQAGLNPLLHYHEYGEAELRQPSENFNPGWYRTAFGLDAEASCLADYLQRRHQEPTSPLPSFDAAAFAQQHPDAVVQGTDLFELYKISSSSQLPPPASDIAAIKASNTFDAAYYQRQYPDAAARGFEPLTHYCGIGWKAGYNPNAVFDTAWYLAVNDDVRSSGINPFYHYLAFGEPEGRRPSADFDPVEYRALHQIEPGASCLADYLSQPNPAQPTLVPVAPKPAAAVADTPVVDEDRETEDEQLIQQSGLFDLNYYLINYPDVRASGLDPLKHFCRYGWQEGRRANPYFDAGWYAKAYLPEGGENPLAHYIRSGEEAGNRPIVYFDPAWYLAQYGTPPQSSALRHFLENRRRQQFSPLRLFDVQRYMALYGAEIGPNRDPFAHYLRVGIYQDIEPSADFDAKNYRMTKMEGTPTRARPVAGAEIHEKLRREALNPLVHFLMSEFAAAPRLETDRSTRMAAV